MSRLATFLFLFLLVVCVVVTMVAAADGGSGFHAQMIASKVHANGLQHHRSAAQALRYLQLLSGDATTHLQQLQKKKEPSTATTNMAAVEKGRGFAEQSCMTFGLILKVAQYKSDLEAAATSATFGKLCTATSHFTQAELECIASTDPNLGILTVIKGFCTTEGGDYCPTVLDGLVSSFSSCNTSATSCPSHCDNSLGFCAPAMNDTLLNQLCSPCVTTALGVASKFILKSVNATATDYLTLSAYVEAWQGVQSTMCVRINAMTSGPLCIEHLGLWSAIANPNDWLAYNMSGICHVQTKKDCFRAVVGGMLDTALAAALRLKELCVQAGGSPAACSLNTTVPAQAMHAQGMALLNYTCAHNAKGVYCIDYVANASTGKAVDEGVKGCANAALNNSIGNCDARCRTTTFRDEFLDMGCCGRVFMALLPDMPSCVGPTIYNTFNTTLPPICAPPQGSAAIPKSLNLDLSWAVVKSNVTLQHTLVKDLSLDIAARLGVLLENIENGTLSETRNSTSSSSFNVSSSRAMRLQQTTAGTTFTFDLVGLPSSTAATASTAFDEQVKAGLVLPLTEQQLVNDGLLEAGKPLAPPADVIVPTNTPPVPVSPPSATPVPGAPSTNAPSSPNPPATSAPTASSAPAGTAVPATTTGQPSAPSSPSSTPAPSSSAPLPSSSSNDNSGSVVSPSSTAASSSSSSYDSSSGSSGSSSSSSSFPSVEVKAAVSSNFVPSLLDDTIIHSVLANASDRYVVQADNLEDYVSVTFYGPSAAANAQRLEGLPASSLGTVSGFSAAANFQPPTGSSSSGSSVEVEAVALGRGLIIGIAVGGCAILALIVLIIYFVVKKPSSTTMDNDHLQEELTQGGDV